MNINPMEVLKRGIISGIDETLTPEDKEYQVAQVGIDLRINEDVILQPKSGKNVEIMEKFDMQDTVGYLWVRSSFSRRLVFISCGIFDPGFCGTGGISLYNMGEEPFEIKKGTRICQVVVYPATFARMYDGHYNKNDSITSQYEEK